ncbi:Glycosyltransferase involved in cell wall bisynthesis [Robiginitalea myxolifaciens]|uniref:Glycosyltransferase involved in cell wall bisynthesis n=1 Tax=Robiginitalea myxolifaciens TaxID=400055 RepID=A0A1I6FN04_9FLAO|nr:glycosyltransferase [Robiginitalea myxolifaciens]SFR31329.1 Glycosyltransferase involved in cell wall bisynthesis [Robiginitalea myxolifaciens]
MVITHVLSSIDNKGGGPSRSCTQLIEELSRIRPDYSIQLLTKITDDPFLNSFKNQNAEIYNLSYDKLGRLEDFKGVVNTIKSSIFHGHGIWQLPVHQMASYSRMNKIPYLISPRGMLEPWSLKQKRLKKNVALKLYQRLDLEKANCIHATSELEAKSIRKLGLNNPIAIIPNGIPLQYPISEFDKVENGRREILFLSRIHPKKGIENLIQAWSMIPESERKEWKVNVVGNGQENYIKSLKNLVKENNLQSSIDFSPPIYGAKKQELFNRAEIFVLPTYTENFGIVVTESLASGTPVITTKGAPWHDLEIYNCGWWIDIGVLPLFKVLRESIKLPKEDLKSMGINGRKLIESKYDISITGNQMARLYEWLERDDPKPDFVV